jgi:hypothetical protein
MARSKNTRHLRARMPTADPAALPPRDFVEALTLPLQQTLAAVRWLDGRVRNRPKLEEQTLEKAALTDADCVAQEILLVALRQFYPHVALEGEEDTPTAAFFAGNESPDTVVIDPIDGTLRYLRGDGHYAVLVGLEHRGRAQASLVAIPRAGLVIRAVRGGGAEISRGGEPFMPARIGTGRPTPRQVLVSYGLPDKVRGRLRAEDLKPVISAGGAIGVAPLFDGIDAGVRIMRDPKGLSRRAWISSLPTLEAGGCVEALEGPFPETFGRGVRGMIVGSSPETVQRLRELLAD